MKNSVLKSRLDLVVKQLGFSGRSFEKQCGLTNGSYSSIGDGVGADKLNKIFVKFPQISADWLLVGRGEMFKQEERNSVDAVGLHTNFEGRSSRDFSEDDFLNNKEMKTILFRMTGIITAQQQDISRLIAEFERNGERSDRILTIIEHEYKITPRRDDSSQKQSAINTSGTLNLGKPEQTPLDIRAEGGATN